MLFLLPPEWEKSPESFDSPMVTKIASEGDGWRERERDCGGWVTGGKGTLMRASHSGEPRGRLLCGWASLGRRAAAVGEMGEMGNSMMEMEKEI